MTDIRRFGVSLPTELLEYFDRRIKGMGYENRSKAIADLIRDRMVEEEFETGSEETVCVVTMVYDHHTSDTVNKLLALQHDAVVDIYSTMHIHMDHDNCLEILAVKGKPDEIRSFADRTKSVRGVKHTGLIATSKEL